MLNILFTIKFDIVPLYNPEIVIQEIFCQESVYPFVVLMKTQLL